MLNALSFSRPHKNLNVKDCINTAKTKLKAIHLEVVFCATLDGLSIMFWSSKIKLERFNCIFNYLVVRMVDMCFSSVKYFFLILCQKFFFFLFLWGGLV